MNTANTKTWTITLKQPELFFDIDELSLGFSQVSGGDNVRRADRLAFDTSSVNGARTAARLCDRRVAEINHALVKFIVPLTTAAADDTFAAGNYVITLQISTEAENSILPSLARLMHDYVVNGALADYYAEMGAGVNTEVLNAKCVANLERIRQMIYYRPMP